MPGMYPEDDPDGEGARAQADDARALTGSEQESAETCRNHLRKLGRLPAMAEGDPKAVIARTQAAEHRRWQHQQMHRSGEKVPGEGAESAEVGTVRGTGGEITGGASRLGSRPYARAQAAEKGEEKEKASFGENFPKNTAAKRHCCAPAHENNEHTGDELRRESARAAPTDEEVVRSVCIPSESRRTAVWTRIHCDGGCKETGDGKETGAGFTLAQGPFEYGVIHRNECERDPLLPKLTCTCYRSDESRLSDDNSHVPRENADR